MDRSSDRTLFYFFLGILIWAPLPLASNRLWSLSLLCGLVLLLSISTLYQQLKGYSIPSTPLKKSLPIIGLLSMGVMWISLQAVPALNLSISPTDSLHDAVWGWCLVAMFCLTLQFVRSRSRILLTGYILVGSALFQAVYGSLMTFTGFEFSFLIPKESYQGVSTGTFINRNSQAGYLVMCVSLGIGLMISTLKDEGSYNWRERSRRWLTALLSKKIILRVALLIIVSGLVMTHSRMGNTSFFASLMIMGVLGLILRRKATRSMVILLSSLLILDIFVVGTFFGVQEVADRLQNTSIEKESRDEVAKATIDLMQPQLLTGTGAGTFYTAFPEHRTEDVGRGFYVNTHNDYLEFSSEFGLLGTLPLGLVLLISLGAGLYAQYKRRDKLLRGIAFGSSMSIIAMLIHATVDFNLQMPANALTFMVILAFTWISVFKKNKRKM
ncbi:O-antigen ligase family protein [Neptuniibacter marinus]|uniref:O-antigen ligase family protein n=1 Tax=Neptuniibacter marinus TaxID=1806670 RepID=UPI000831E9E3|nr:O-antigen ligase family protein [Neptuniibacter marinus]